MNEYMVMPAVETPRGLLVNFSAAHESSHVLRGAGAPPVVIPAGQEYYWTGVWQAGERETLAELASGGGRTFGTADEALRYLFSAKDE